MLNTKLPIYLASKSPRRKKLLKQLGINFKSFSIDLEEEIFENESPIKTVKRLASQKMQEAEIQKRDGILITADTIVVLDKEIIGKPKSKRDAKLILENSIRAAFCSEKDKEFLQEKINNYFIT